MSENTENHTPEGKPEEKPFQASIQITKGKDGKYGLQAIGEGFTMIECRKMIEWALNTVNEKLMDDRIEEYIKSAAQKKIVRPGFRNGSFLNIFR